MLCVALFLVGFFLSVAGFALCLQKYGWPWPVTPPLPEPGYTDISADSCYRDKQRRRAEHAEHFATLSPPLFLKAK